MGSGKTCPEGLGWTLRLWRYQVTKAGGSGQIRSQRRRCRREEGLGSPKGH